MDSADLSAEKSGQKATLLKINFWVKTWYFQFCNFKQIYIRPSYMKTYEKFKEAQTEPEQMSQKGKFWRSIIGINAYSTSSTEEV